VHSKGLSGTIFLRRLWKIPLLTTSIRPPAHQRQSLLGPKTRFLRSQDRQRPLNAASRAERKPLGHRLNALAIARTDQPRHVERAHLSPRLVSQPIQKRLEKVSKLFFPIRRPASHGRPIQKPTTHESQKK